MDLVNLTIDGIKVSVPAGSTVLEAARSANIQIPTLCYLKDVNQIGACRMCLVDTGARALAAACVMPVSEGMNVKTNTPAIREARKVNMELLLSNHDRKCLTCVRSRNCELQTLAEELGVRDVRFEGYRSEYPIDDKSLSVVRDPNKCIQCRRCIAACHNVQKIGVIGTVGRGFGTVIAPAWENETTTSSRVILFGRTGSSSSSIFSTFRSPLSAVTVSSRTSALSGISSIFARAPYQFVPAAATISCLARPSWITFMLIVDWRRPSQMPI